MLRRSQRTSVEQAAKYLRATTLKIGTFKLDLDFEANDEAFTSQVGTLHPLCDLAAELGASRAVVNVPASNDVSTYQEFFDQTSNRLVQVASVLKDKGIALGVGFRAGKEFDEGKQYQFVRNVEGLLGLVRSSAGVGLLLDTWEWVVGDGAMDQISELKADDIVAVQLGSVCSETDVTKATSCDRVLPEKETGFNHVALVKHLASVGYEGPISPSSSPAKYKGQTRENTVKGAQEAVDGIYTDAELKVDPLPMDAIEELTFETTTSI